MDSECLTVFFEDPFWVGVFERVKDGRLSVCKVTFGAQPKDAEVYDFVQREYRHLEFSPAVSADSRAVPSGRKHQKRLAQRQMKHTGIGTKAQQALQMQREEAKAAHRERSKAEQEAEAARQFQLRQEKRKKKHRGR